MTYESLNDRIKSYVRRWNNAKNIGEKIFLEAQVLTELFIWNEIKKEIEKQEPNAFKN